MHFETYFWSTSKIPHPARLEFLKLISLKESLEKKLERFHNLLLSDSVTARGIAFDQFSFSVEPQRLKIESYHTW